jgi:hypothetical protein
MVMRERYRGQLGNVAMCGSLSILMDITMWRVCSVHIRGWWASNGHRNQCWKNDITTKTTRLTRRHVIHILCCLIHRHYEYILIHDTRDILSNSKGCIEVRLLASNAWKEPTTLRSRDYHFDNQPLHKSFTVSTPDYLDSSRLDFV